MRVVNSILELIGHTPLLRLNKIAATAHSRIFLKLEYLNPSGSYKDRIALRMIANAEARGDVKPGHTIIESSSGNTAIALALVGAVKGYNVRIFYPEDVWVPEKKQTLQRYGAEIEVVSLVETDAARNAGVHGARVEVPGRVKCHELDSRHPDMWWARQFSNPDNVSGHNEMAQELLDQLGGEIDVFISSIGTGGNLLGVSQVLKQAIPDITCIAVQPTGWPGWMDPLAPDVKFVPGITGGIIERIKTQGVLDKVVYVGNEDAHKMAYRLSREEGVFSTGANVFVALNEARERGAGKNIVTVAVDRGDRYFSDERYIT